MPITLDSSSKMGFFKENALFGVVMLAPFATLFVAEPWQYIAGLVPPFWVAKVFSLRAAPVAVFTAVITAGLAVHIAWLWGLSLWYVRRDR